MKKLSISVPRPIPPPPKPSITEPNWTTINERVSVLVQALRLTLRHLDGKSGLSDQEIKDYINTTLKIY